MPEWTVSALIGLVIGTAVSFLNNFILMQGMKKAEELTPAKERNIIMLRYGIRYLLNLAVLFLVYKNTAMLVAAAIGLTLNKNVLFLKYFLRNKQKKG